jgi:L-asparaginase II
VAVKVADGAQRAVQPALARFLTGLEIELRDDFARVPVENSRGEIVGETRA